MSDYSKLTDFGDKDALASGNVLKRIMGAEVDAELDSIVTHMATKYDTTDRGVASGVASLDANTLLPEAQLPLSAVRVSIATFTPSWRNADWSVEPTGDWVYQKLTWTVGVVIFAIVHLQPLSGSTVSGTTAATPAQLRIENIPALIRPQDASVTVPTHVQNSGAAEAGIAVFDTAGNMDIYRNAAGAYSTAANTGLYGTGPQFVYSFQQSAT